MTEALWVALAVMAVPIVLLLATAGCGTVLPAAADVPTPQTEPSPETPPPATVPTTPKKPDPRTEASGGLSTDVQLKPTYASTVLGTVGLVGYWRLGEDQVELAKPQPQAQNAAATANLNGRYVSPPGVELEVKGALAKGDDGAARFDGGYVEVPFQPVLQLDEATVELWLKIDAPEIDWRPVVSYYETPLLSATVVRGFRLRAKTVLESGVSALVVEGIYGGMSTALELKRKPAAGWHYVMLTYNKTLGQERAELHVDDQVAVANVKCTLTLTNQQPLRLAAPPGGSSTRLSGSLDEVALYGQHMTQAVVDLHRKMAT